MKKQRRSLNILLMAVFLPALALLPGCGPDVTTEKQLVCVLPDALLPQRDRSGRFEDSPSWRNLIFNGTRYAYILPINDSLSVLKTNGMELKGNFTQWKGHLGCGMVLNTKAWRQYRHLRIDTDPSWTTFTITDKQGKRQVYIDNQKADTNLYKSYTPIWEKGILKIDTSIYELTTTTYRQETDHQGNSWQQPHRTTNFYFKGRKGPDFRSLEGVHADPAADRYTYIGKLYPGSPRYLNIPVIDGKVYWNYSLPISGYIGESTFGDLYFAFIDTVRNKQGYWINDVATTARFDRVGDIAFRGKNDYEFIGINEALSVDSSSVTSTYFLVNNNQVSGPYTYIEFVNGPLLPDHETSFPDKKVLLTGDSIFCYQDNRLVYRNRFACLEEPYSVTFQLLQKPERIVLRINSHGPHGNFFCINDNCFQEQTFLPEKEDPNYYRRDLHKYLGISFDGARYARIEYVYPDENTRKALLYVNDSLIGTFPYDVELLWAHEDGFALKGEYGSLKDRLRSRLSWDTVQYQKYVADHYPDGVPAILDKVLPQDTQFIAGKVGGKIPFTFREDHFDILGRKIYTRNADMAMGVTTNDHFYHLSQNEPDRMDVLFVDFEPVYSSPRILFPSQAQNYISFYSLEGNSLYLVTCNLNSWPTRLQQFLQNLLP